VVRLHRSHAIEPTLNRLWISMVDSSSRIEFCKVSSALRESVSHGFLTSGILTSDALSIVRTGPISRIPPNPSVSQLVIGWFPRIEFAHGFIPNEVLCDRHGRFG
jgi:hypothetical protein